MELLLSVGRPRHWLDQVLTPGCATLQIAPKTPSELRDELVAFVKVPIREPRSGWLSCRDLDDTGGPPIPALAELDPLAWVVEFAHERVHPVARALALGPRTAVRLQCVESRARAFLEMGLRGVEQWSCAGFPDVVVTLGHCPAQLP